MFLVTTICRLLKVHKVKSSVCISFCQGQIHVFSQKGRWCVYGFLCFTVLYKAQEKYSFVSLSTVLKCVGRLFIYFILSPSNLNNLNFCLFVKIHDFCVRKRLSLIMNKILKFSWCLLMQENNVVKNTRSLFLPVSNL